MLLAIGHRRRRFWSKHGPQLKRRRRVQVSDRVRTMEIAAFVSVLILMSPRTCACIPRSSRAVCGSSRSGQRTCKEAGGSGLPVDGDQDGRRRSPIPHCRFVGTSWQRRGGRQNAGRAANAPMECTALGVDTTPAPVSRSRRRIQSRDRFLTKAWRPRRTRKRGKLALDGHFVLHWLILQQLSLSAPTWFPWHARAGLVLAGLVASIFFGANAFSMNALYGNRLRAHISAHREPSRT